MRDNPCRTLLAPTIHPSHYAINTGNTNSNNNSSTANIQSDLFWLASIHESHPVVGVNLAIAKSTSHAHEEQLVVILRPVEDVVPEEESVSCIFR